MNAINNPQATTGAGIQAEKVASYLNALAVDEVHVANAVGVDVSGVYQSSTVIQFKDSRHPQPPRVLAFRVDTSEPQNLLAAVIPSYVTAFDPFLTIFGGGFIIQRWSVAEIFTTSVTINTYSISEFEETYVVYVLKDKANERLD